MQTSRQPKGTGRWGVAPIRRERCAVRADQRRLRADAHTVPIEDRDDGRTTQAKVLDAPICVPDNHATSPRTSKNRTRITSQRVDPFCARKREVESKVVRSRPGILVTKIEWARHRESNVGEHRRRRVDEPG